MSAKHLLLIIEIVKTVLQLVYKNNNKKTTVFILTFISVNSSVCFIDKLILNKEIKEKSFKIQYV